jgi:hypothetical protein
MNNQEIRNARTEKQTKEIWKIYIEQRKLLKKKKKGQS